MFSTLTTCFNPALGSSSGFVLLKAKWSTIWVWN